MNQNNLILTQGFNFIYQHTLIVVDPVSLIDAPMITGPKSSAPFLYRGTGLIADKANPLVLEVLTGSSTSYSYKPDSPVEEVLQYVLILGPETQFFILYFSVPSCCWQKHCFNCCTPSTQ